MKQIDFSLEQLFNGIAMRKLLFIMVATLVSIQGKAQVFQLNASDFGITTNTPVAAEMQWADNTAVTLSNAFATNHDAFSCANDGYTKVLIDNNEIQTAAGVHGYDNPKDADNNNPATTLNVPASGSVIQIEAKKNGWLYIVARLSSNKQYMVFEDGEAIGYKYALENLDSRVSNHVMTGEVGTAGSSLNRQVQSLICEYTGDSEAASAGNGLGVFYFPVKKGSSYYAHACGSKILWCGAYFSKTEAEIVKVVKEDESELILVNQPSPNITFTDSNVKALCVANWDTNDDGELSEAEAAAVTDLGEVFKNNTSITSFNELQYFIGLENIGDYAFNDCTGLTSITIPNSVTSIGKYALASCTGLTSIAIPNGVTSIGNYAFLDSDALISVHISDLDAWCKIDFSNYASNPLTYAYHLYLDEEEITELVIPSTVTTISRYAFQGCSGLTSVTIGSGVTSIDTDAFAGCIGLTSVTIPNSVTSIGNSAFYNCSSLTSVTIPNSVTSIGEQAFYNCRALSSVTIGNSVSSIGRDAFLYCDGLKSVHISDLDAWCRLDFYYSSSNPLSYAHHLYLDEEEITELVIPSTVTSIGHGAFQSCRGLTSVTIPNSVTSIGASAFAGCFNLTSITIPNSVTSIGYGAFSGCGGLTSVTIPNSVTSIDRSTFYNCSGLTSITIPNSVTSIGADAFQNCDGLTSVTIPNSVISIGDYAFYDCDGLTSVTIGNSVTSIGNHAFDQCTSLTVVVVDKETPLSISSNVFIFMNPANATLVVPIGSRNDYLSASYWNTFGTIMEMASNGYYTFTDSKGLGWNCYLYNGNVTLKARSIDDDPTPCVYGLPSNLTIPSTVKIRYVDYPVTSLGFYSFYDMTGLTSITIPNSVTSIDASAFVYCDALTSVHISDLEAWCRIGFGNSSSNPLSYAHHLYLDDEEITELVIPSTITTIGNYAFDGCSGLTSVTIPNSVTTIGNSAFYGCDGLTSVIIPNGVTSIGNYAFYGCSGLTSVTIPNSVTSIGGGAFSGCSGLTSVTIPNSVTSIGDNAFYNCSNLTSVTIPNSVTSIGPAAFSGCSNLTSVIVEKAAPISIGANVFSNRTNATLYVPAGSKSAYEAATYWQDFKEIVEMNVEISIGSAGMGTFCSVSALDFSGTEDIKAYIVSAFKPGTGEVILTRITDVPANTGIVVKGEENIYSIPPGPGDIIVSNMLVGVTEDTPLNKVDGDYTNYILAKKGGNLGFFAVTDGSTLSAGKAYLPLPTASLPSSAREFSLIFDDEETTGVTDIRSKKADVRDEYYNLAGQRVAQPTKGVYIVNGKKVFIK